MPIYEVTAAGFDAASDGTDDRVLWVHAPDEATLQAAIADTGAKFWGGLPLGMYADFTLPRETLALQEHLLQFASDERNKTRAVKA